MFEQELLPIKKANKITSYTQKQLEELFHCQNDPLYFLTHFNYIQHAQKGKILFEPFPYQLEMIKLIHSNRMSICCTGRQQGKALAIDTPIPTPTGWTTMGELKVGDVILDENGMNTTVIFATDIMYDHECYDVVFDTGEIITADAEHLWALGNPRYNKKNIKTTEQLGTILSNKTEKSRSTYIDSTKPLVFNDVDLPIPPYTLGVWLGDGNSADGRFHSWEKENNQMRYNIEQDGFTLSPPIKDKRNNCMRQTIYGLSPKLRGLKILNNKKIPSIYLRSSYEQRLDLLKGLMDTDGNACKCGGCEFYQKNLDLILDVKELLASLGIKSRLRTKIIKGQKYYELGFATTIPVFKLERKKNIQLSCTSGHKKNTRHYIHAIKKTESVPVRCIQVDSPNHLFLCGKSMIPTHNTTVVGSYLLWYAMFVEQSTILIVANKLVSALEIMHRVRYAYEECPDHIKAGVVEYNKGTITFDNGSRIIARATTPDAGRGLSVSLLYVDEMGFLETIALGYEFWTAISPTLATGGRAAITSTPNSDQDIFAELWRGANDRFDDNGNESPIGKNGFAPFMATWRDHPERDEQWASEQRASLGESRFMREYECQFYQETETLINEMTLARMQGVDPQFTTGQIRWYNIPEPNKTFVVALDPSMGTGGDYAAIEVFQLPEMKQIAEWKDNKTDIRGQITCLMQVLLYIHTHLRSHDIQSGDPEIYWTVENNSIGEAALIVIEETGEENFPGEMVSELRRSGNVRRFRKGLNTTNKTKIEACSRLKSLVDTERLVPLSKNLVSELKNFVPRGGSYAAKLGMTDDLVSATLLCVRMLQILQSWGVDEMDNLKDVIPLGEHELEPMPIVIF
jgi:hypothetical protein